MDGVRDVFCRLLPVSSRAVRAVSAIAAVSLSAGAFTGCAGWAVWKDPKEASKLAEQYGRTAKQRIAEIETGAKEAKKSGKEREDAFARELAASILGEHDPQVRGSIVEVAAGLDAPAAEAICEGALQDPDSRVRMAACDAWGTRGGSRGVELLSDRSRKETDVDVRLRAIRTLGELEDKAAIPALAEALEDPDPAVQYRAVASLKSVSGRDLGDDVNAWRTWAASDPATRDASWSMAETFRKIF